MLGLRKWAFLPLCMAVLMMGLLVCGGCGESDSSTPSTPADQPANGEASGGEAEVQELVIGDVAGLSGPGSEAVSLLSRGYDLAAEWINEQGGIEIDGTKYHIRLIHEDDQMSPDGSLAAVNKLIFDHGVKFILGPPVADFLMAIEPIVKSNEILMTHAEAEGEGPEFNSSTVFTFTSRMSGATAKDFFARALQEYPEVETIAFAVLNDSGGLGRAEYDKAGALEQGLTITATEFYDFGADDFYPMWTKILSANPDAVCLGAGFPQWLASIVKQGRELGFEGPIFITGPSGDPYIISELAGAEYATDIITLGYAFLDDNMTPMIKDMMARVEAKYNISPPTVDYLFAWDTLWTLTQAIEAAQSLDPIAVRDSWEKMTDIDTIAGPGTMGGGESIGLNHVVCKPQPVTKIMDGEPVHLDWVYSIVP